MCELTSHYTCFNSIQQMVDRLAGERTELGTCISSYGQHSCDGAQHIITMPIETNSSSLLLLPHSEEKGNKTKAQHLPKWCQMYAALFANN